MPRGTGGDQSLQTSLGIDDGNIDSFRFASVGSDGDRLSIRGGRIAGQMVLHLIAVAHREFVEPTIGPAYVHLPPLGAASVRGNTGPQSVTTRVRMLRRLR